MSYIIYTLVVLYLSKEKVRAVAARRMGSVAGLARTAGISRQSLYNMFHDTSVFNTSFIKLLQVLGLSYQELTEERSAGDQLLADAPASVRRVALRLIDFCRDHAAALLLFGSRVRGKTGPQVDWDFAVWFRGTVRDRALRTCKQGLRDAAFPYRVDIVNLNQAPVWFRDSVDRSHLVLYGIYP